MVRPDPRLRSSEVTDVSPPPLGRPCRSASMRNSSARSASGGPSTSSSSILPMACARAEWHQIGSSRAWPEAPSSGASRSAPIRPGPIYDARRAVAHQTVPARRCRCCLCANPGGRLAAPKREQNSHAAQAGRRAVHHLWRQAGSASQATTEEAAGARVEHRNSSASVVMERFRADALTDRRPVVAASSCTCPARAAAASSQG